MNNTIFASPLNKANRNKLYSSLDGEALNKDLDNINSKRPNRISLPIIRKSFVKSVVPLNKFENRPSQISGLEPEFSQVLTSKKKIRPKFHKIESMLQSATMLLQDFDSSNVSSKKTIKKQEFETDRYNFVKNDPFLDISVNNQTKITQLSKEVALLKIENKRQK